MRLARRLGGLLLAVHAGIAPAGDGLIAADGATAAGANVPPFTSAAEVGHLLDEENRVWGAARDLEKALRNRGTLCAEPTLDAYLQRVTDGLFPEFGGTLKVRCIKEPSLNAFALPSGSLFVHLGLIARLDNEAQLATVLAHEGGHFIHRHGFQSAQSLKSTAAFATVIGMAGGVAGLVGQLAALSSAYGYSRDLERDADQVAYLRLKAAGYRLSEASRSLEMMAAEAQLLEFKEPFLFASHPKLQERIANFAELTAREADPQGGRDEAAAFQDQVGSTREAWMALELARGQYKSLIYHLSLPNAASKFGALASRYYLAEAYRLRGQEGDGERALTSLGAALELAPEHAPSYRSRGLILLKAGDPAGARSAFARSLALAPSASDAGYLRAYIEQIDNPPSATPPLPSDKQP